MFNYFDEMMDRIITDDICVLVQPKLDNMRRYCTWSSMDRFDDLIDDLIDYYSTVIMRLGQGCKID